MKRRTALVGSLAALTAATSAKAADLPVDLQLVLAVDVSRSIDEVEAELQRRGYIEALTNERVIDAVLSGENRRIALCYTEWAGTHYQMVVIDWTVIDSASAARRFAEKLAEAPRTSQSWTAVGAAMAHAAQRFEGSGFTSRRRVIDISGDGRTNDGPPAELVRDKLVAQGIVINGLPVMMNRTNFGRPPDLTLDKYYEENVIGGPGLVHDRGRQFRPFRPCRAHQAGARGLGRRRQASANTCLSRSNGAVSRVSCTGMPRWPSGYRKMFVSGSFHRRATARPSP